MQMRFFVVCLVVGGGAACSAGGRDAADPGRSPSGEEADAGTRRDASSSAPDAGVHYDPDCARRLAARAPDPRLGTTHVVLDPSFLGDTPAAFCAGAGGVLADVGPEGTRLTGTMCRGRLAREAFRFGVCSCGDIRAQYLMHGTNALSPIGANGGIALSAYADVSELVAAGCDGIAVAERIDVRGNVQSNGLVTAPLIGVGRDLFTAAGVSGTATVDRDAWLSPGASVTGSLTVGGTRREAGVDVPYPCVCDGSFVDDIHTLVDAGSASADEHHTDVTAPYEMTLDCGRHAWTGAFPRIVRIHGRVAIFVRGDIRDLMRIELAAGSSLVLFVGGSIRNDDVSFTVELGEDATIDAFVAEDFVVGGAIDFGEDWAAERSRWYVGGDELTAIGGAIRFSGSFYAPDATIGSAGGAISVVGSLVAASIDTGGGVIVEHPEGASDIGECEMPDVPCASCADCAGDQACVGGACGDCRTDADCCAPLVCVDGACVTNLI